jgi:spore maturation protein CgeB
VFEEGDGVIYESTQRSLLERVKELLINPEMASAVARRGQDLVQKHFAWERNVMKFEDLIRSVIKLNHLSQ